MLLPIARVGLVGAIVLLASSVAQSSIQLRGSGEVGPTFITTSASPPHLIGDIVTLSCPFGKITLVSTQMCNNQIVNQDVCATTPSCVEALKGSMSSGHTFNRWLASGDAAVTCSTCITTSATFNYPQSGYYSGAISECPTPPTITNVQTNAYHSFEQEWINWSDPSVTTTQFQWGTTTSYSLPSPEPSVRSVDLNVLNASTTYYYKVTDSSNCDTSTPNIGSFTTPPASTSDFVGWLFETHTGNAHLNLPTGPPLVSAYIGVGAICTFWDGWSTYPGYVNFTGSTDIFGHYDLAFPLSFVFSTGGTTYSFALNTGGNCDSSESGTLNGGPWTHGNSEYILDASAQGYWNETRMVSATMSSLNDDQTFVLTANQIGTVTLALALMDDSPGQSTAPPVQCGFDLTAGVSTSVENNIGGNGASSTYSNERSWGASDAGWGVDTGIYTRWYVGGTVNDSHPSNILSTSYPIGWRGIESPSPSTTTDWVSVPAYTGQAPSGAWAGGGIEIQPRYTESNPDLTMLGLTQTTTFSSSTGIELSVDVGISFGFLDVGTSVTLSYTQTNTYASTSTLSCEGYDPSASATAVLWYYEDYSQAGSSDILHMAFMGYCGTGTQYTC
jgi:hypothetical protein